MSAMTYPLPHTPISNPRHPLALPRRLRGLESEPAFAAREPGYLFGHPLIVPDARLDLHMFRAALTIATILLFSAFTSTQATPAATASRQRLPSMGCLGIKSSGHNICDATASSSTSLSLTD
jgi:hypothetical protein